MIRKQDIILSLILSLFVICFAIIIVVFCKYLYAFDIDYLHISEYTGLSKETIQHNYDVLIQYQSIFYQGELHLPDFVMSTQGRIHFQEVKRIFEGIQIAFVGFGILSMIMVYHRIKQKEYRFLQTSAYVCIGGLCVLGFLVALDFDKAFVLFHQIVFRNDYWIFDAITDPVITILPERYFMHCFIMIIFIVIAVNILFIIIYNKKKKQILNNA